MLYKYKIANTMRTISEPKNGITIIPNPTGSGKSYETAIFIAWMLMNSERKIIFVTTRIAHLNRIENDIAYHLKQMGEHDKIEKIVQIKSFVNCIKQSFLKLSDDIEKVANRNSELKEVFTVLRSELIRLNIETNNAKNNQDSNKAIIKSINEHISNLEPKFRWLLSKEFAQSYKYNKYDENGNRVSSYDYMMNSEEWKFISELYPSSQHSQKQVFIMTSAKFLEKDDPIISERYDFIKGEHLKDAIVIIDEVDAVKEDFLRKILSNDLKKNIVDTFKVIYRTFENVDEMDPDTIEVSKSIGKIKAISNRSKEIKEKYFPSKWVVKLFEKDENGELQEANIIDKLMNFYSVDNYFDTNRKYVYIPFTDDREDPDNMTQCNIIISENDLDDDIKPKITMYNIADFIREVNQFINRTFFDLRTISNKYMENENKRNELNPSKEILWINEKDAISTLLTQLSFSEKNVEYLVGKIVSATDFKNFKEALKSNNPDTPIGRDVYDRGLCYTSITQNYSSRHSYTLDNYEIQYTPELILAYVASRAHVIGISATPENPGIQNFFWSFIKKKLNNLNIKDNDVYEERATIHKLQGKLLNILKEDYSEKTYGYFDEDGNIKIDTWIKGIDFGKDNFDPEKNFAMLLTGKNDVTRSDIRNLINDPKLSEIDEFIKNMKSLKDSYISDDKMGSKLYDYSRLMKICLYIQSVLLQFKDKNFSKAAISNGIIMTNKLIDISKDSNEIFSLKNLKLATTCICSNVFNISTKEAKKMANSMFIIIKADDLNSGKAQEKFDFVRDRILENKPVFMLTSYLSVSRGNNLQINIGKDEVRNRLDAGDLLPVNDWPTSGDVDWDSIYMEKPSHVIPDLKNDLSSLDENNDIITGRLKLFLTVEELFARGDINKHKKNDILKEVFDYLESGYAEKLNARLKNYNDIYRLFSVKTDYTTIVYQTMGRIVRTSVKKPCNAIFYDVDMLEHIITDTDKLNLPIITNEFDRFLSHVKKEVTSIFKSALENSNLEFRRKNRDVYLAINDILTAGNGDFGWDKDLQQLWEFLRETVLKYPVISKKELKKVQEEYNSLKFASQLKLNIEDLYLDFKKTVKDDVKYFYAPYSSDPFGSNSNKYFNDFEDVIIHSKLSNNRPNRLLKFEVSLEDCRLSKLLKNRVVREHWTKNKFNSNWKLKKGERFYGVISPIVYNNIYKGAIGEEVAKSLFKENDIDIEPISDPKSYEKFDFLIKNNDKKVYVDAKNFSDYSMIMDFANKDLLKKTKEKARKLDADAIILVNLIDEYGKRNPVEFLVSRDSSNNEDNGKPIKFISFPGIFYMNISNQLDLSRDREGNTIFYKIKDIIDNLVEDDVNQEVCYVEEEK
ncbi:hypothetical protein [Peptacetobacter sp. AB845]|uniref:hypothetical protein n=1 Tax=Peptacetobacter sp. AB845 TaxID=3388429 RepID=UPI0039C94C3E